VSGLAGTMSGLSIIFSAGGRSKGPDSVCREGCEARNKRENQSVGLEGAHSVILGKH